MLQQIGEGIWTFENSVSLGLGFVFPVRTTVLRANDGTVTIYGPLDFDDETVDAIRQIGPVAHIVAPNLFHHLFFGHAAERFPDATRHGARGLTRKRPDLTLDRELGQDADAHAFGPGITSRFVPGTQVRETVLVHEPSRSLVVADLVFNIHETETWVSTLGFSLLGVRGRVKQSPLWRMATKDRQAAAAACEDVLSGDWDRLVMAHGRVVEEDAREQARAGLAWMLRS